MAHPLDLRHHHHQEWRLGSGWPVFKPLLQNMHVAGVCAAASARFARAQSFNPVTLLAHTHTVVCCLSCTPPTNPNQHPYHQQNQVNPNIRRDKWTADEDAKLIELVKTFGVGRWAEIARNCDGRTDQQCMGRWRRHLDPAIKRVSGLLAGGSGRDG